MVLNLTRAPRALSIAVAGVALAAAVAWAAWPTDPRGSLSVGTGTRHADAPRLAPDGAGGAIVVWQGNDAGSASDIVVQHVDSTGQVLWPSPGVPVSNESAERRGPQVLPDGAHGAIVVWQELRHGRDWDLYAQRLDPNGVAVWAPEGMPVSVAPGDQLSPQISTDGHGGVIVTWENRPRARGYGASGQPAPQDTTRSSDVFAQRLDSTGVARWAPNGVPITGTAGNEFQPTVVTDGHGGAYVTWVDVDPSSKTVAVAAQRVDSIGNVLWRPPVWIARDAESNTSPAITSDRQGGAIVAWNGKGGVLARRIRPDRPRQPWGLDPVLLSSRVFFGPPVAIPTGDGGAIVAWSGGRDPDVVVNIFAQRVGPNGERRWGDAGKPVCPMRGAQTEPAMVRDGAGGAILVWRDARSGAPTDLYAQRIDSTGVVQWPKPGVAMCLSPGEVLSTAMIPDGTGGAILAWQNRRIEGRINAQRVTGFGELGGTIVRARRP